MSDQSVCGFSCWKELLPLLVPPSNSVVLPPPLARTHKQHNHKDAATIIKHYSVVNTSPLDVVNYTLDS